MSGSRVLIATPDVLPVSELEELALEFADAFALLFELAFPLLVVIGWQAVIDNPMSKPSADFKHRTDR